jgi:hypothetical protein
VYVLYGLSVRRRQSQTLAQHAYVCSWQSVFALTVSCNVVLVGTNLVMVANGVAVAFRRELLAASEQVNNEFLVCSR